MAQAKQPGLSPSEQAAVRAISSSLSSILQLTSALGMCFYAAAALALDRVGTKKRMRYMNRLPEECEDVVRDFKKLQKDEENPAKIDWNC